MAPCRVTEELTDDEIGGDYVLNTGIAITRRFQGIDPMAVPAVLVAGHAPFCWGKSPDDAAHNAVVLETVARMAFTTTMLNAESTGVSQSLLDRHYQRKHGAKATYGSGKMIEKTARVTNGNGRHRATDASFDLECTCSAIKRI